MTIPLRVPRAIVLAAGEGTRIRPIGGDLPKVLVPVAGVPAIDRILAWLAGQGVREVALNLHHRGDEIAHHVGDGGRWGLAVRYSVEETLLGTAGACRPLADFLSGTFLVVYGDVLTDLDLGELLAFHRRGRAVLTMAVYEVPNPTECGIVELAADGRMLRLVEKPAAHEVFSTLANTGILLAEPAVLDYLPADRPSDFGRDLLPALLAAEEPVYGWPIGPGVTVVDMGTLAGYRRAEAWLSAVSPTRQE